MEFISLGHDLATGTQIRASFEPLQMASLCMGIGVFLLDKLFQRLGQEARNRSLTFDGYQLDFEQDFLRDRQGNILCFHRYLHVKEYTTKTREKQLVKLMEGAQRMQITRLTAIARPIDPNYPTNLAIAVLAMIVAAAGTIFQLLTGMELIPSAGWGISAGFAAFLAWALSREFDPDHGLSAFVGTGLALLGLWFLDLPNLMTLFWMLVLVRIVNRTSGLPARILDSLLLLGLGSWLTWQGNWGFGLVTALAFFLDSRLPPPHRHHLPFAGLALLVTALLFAVKGSLLGEGKLSVPVLLAVLIASALFVVVILTSRRVRSVGDETGEPLSPKRVQAAQALALATGIQIALWDSTLGMASIMPLWAAILGVSLYRLFAILSRKE
jgi:hypothetical protein